MFAKAKKISSLILSILVVMTGSLSGTFSTVFAVEKVATPEISAPSDMFTGSQNVTITATSGAAIRYTTDGSEPSASSQQYSGPFPISATTTIKAYATAADMTDSDVASKTYTLSVPQSDSKLGSASDNFDKNSPKDITISMSLNGNTLSSIKSPSKTLSQGSDYTSDSSSVVLKSDFLKTLSAGDTILTFSFSAGSTASFTVKVTDSTPVVVQKPTSSLEEGKTYSGTQSITLYCSTSSAQIFYTTNGSTPSNNPSTSTPYSSNSPIKLSSNTTLKAVAYYNGSSSAVSTYNYTINTAAPTASLAEGTYTGSRTVTLSCATNDAKIYYTTNGTTPSDTSYTTSPVNITGNTTLKAIAYYNGIPSSVSTFNYTINSTVAAPTASPSGGSSLTTVQNVSLACSSSGATIYYTIDGSTPTTTSKTYSSTITINSPTTLKAVAYCNNTYSAVSTYTYSYNFAPTASLSSGIITSSNNVTLSCSLSADIYYTLNGSTPTTNSYYYSSSRKISIDSTTTLKTIACYNSSNGKVYSDVNTYKYTYLPAPTASVSSGTYDSSKTVSLYCSLSDAKIYYTLDGSTPSYTGSSSYLYNNSSFTISSNKTLKIISYYKDPSTSAIATSSVVQYDYNILNSVNAPVANISSGTYNSPQFVTLSCGTPSATIYYTTDGSTPSTSSTKYTANSNINIYASTTLKAIAYYGSTASSINSYTYLIDLSTSKFTDLGNYSWAKTQIESLAKSGVIKGTSDTTFSPAANIKRADFICLLVRTLGLSSQVNSNFDDVSSSAYYYTEVGIAKSLGICSGVGGNRINPNQVITR